MYIYIYIDNIHIYIYTDNRSIMPKAFYDESIINEYNLENLVLKLEHMVIL